MPNEVAVIFDGCTRLPISERGGGYVKTEIWVSQEDRGQTRGGGVCERCEWPRTCNQHAESRYVTDTVQGDRDETDVTQSIAGLKAVFTADEVHLSLEEPLEGRVLPSKPVDLVIEKAKPPVVEMEW
jgi:hypothetical protein